MSERDPSLGASLAADVIGRHVQLGIRRETRESREVRKQKPVSWRDESKIKAANNKVSLSVPLHFGTEVVP